MAMKIATRHRRREQAPRRASRQVASFEAGLESLEAMQIAAKTPMFRRMKQGDSSWVGSGHLP